MNFWEIPIFANNFTGSEVRLNSILETCRRMEEYFCLGKQNGDRGALCLMYLLASYSAFISS